MSPRSPRPLSRVVTVTAAILGVLVMALVGASPANAAFGYLAEWAGVNQPMGIATDATGNVYVAECAGDDVKKFNASGAVDATWAANAGGDSASYGGCARDVAVDTAAGIVYVVDADFSDPYASVVKRFNLDGTVAAPASFNGSGATGGAFQQTFGVAVDATNGHVYVVDNGPESSPAPRLLRFSTSGVFQSLIGSAGVGDDQYSRPVGVGAEAGFVYASDLDHVHSLKKWSSAGTFQAYSPNGVIQTPNYGSLAPDGSGNLYATDPSNHRIIRLITNGSLLEPQQTWGGNEPGLGPATFNNPLDLATFSTTALYIADTANNRIVKYGAGAASAPTVTTGEAVGVTWLTGTLNGTINPQGTATQYQFRYGLTTDYGSTTPATPADAGSGMTDVAVTGALTGLNAERTYHYKLVALRGGSIVAEGADRTFTTWPDPGVAPFCARVGHTIGVVGVCADAMTYDAGRWTASGNVILNTGVGVSGPIVLNDSSGLISSTAGVTVTVNRDSPINMGTGLLEIATGGISDPVSNRSGLGLLTIGNPVGILLGAMPFAPLASHYLDTRDGGGIILTGRPSFDLLGPLANATLPTGSFSVGMHRTASKPFDVLGGSVKWDAIQLAAAWKIGFSVGYAEGPPSLFSFMGKFEAPFLPAGTGAEFSGAFAGSRLDQAGIKITTPGVPLGNTGIFMDTFAGSLKGISGGQNNPLIISVTVGGGWMKTNVPDPFNWILHIKDVGLTLDTSGSGTLAGEVDVLDGEGRLVKATAQLTLQLAPSFLASGSLIGTFNGGLVSTNLSLTASMNTSHFTARGDVTGKILGTTIGSGSGVLSDKGVGVTSRLCVPYWWFGWHEVCSDLGAGLTWANVASWPPAIEYIGSDINRYVTLTASAAATAQTAASTRSFAVRRHNPFLHVEARGGDSADFELVSPIGIHYRPGSTRRDTASQTIQDVTTMVVYGPPTGTWRLRSLTSKSTRFSIQTIPDLGRVRPVSVRPAGTSAKRLSPCAPDVRVSWRRDGFLPADTRLSLYAATSSKAPGKLLRSGLGTTGRVTVKVSSLNPAVNHLYLVPKSEGVEFGYVRFAKTVWTKAPALGQLCTSAVRPSSTKTRRLARRVRSVRLAWRLVGSVPTGTRLLLFRATSATGAGKLLRSDLPTTGRTTLKVSSLAKGANHLYLVPSTPQGVRLPRTGFAKPVWKR